MRIYVLEAYVPRSRLPRLAELETATRALAAALRREGRSVRQLEAIYLPADETCFLVFEADGRHLVEELASRLDVAVIRIAEAVALQAPGAR